jgi:uncharacterized protein YbjQ (UPF0145 family)
LNNAEFLTLQENVNFITIAFGVPTLGGLWHFRSIRVITFRMIVTTGNDVAGREVGEYLGVVRGIVVRATGIGRGFIGGLKSIAGGNIEEFTVVCEEARMDAFNRMVRHAHEIHADAVIGMRYDATEFGQGSTEVLAYGTAVKLA